MALVKCMYLADRGTLISIHRTKILKTLSMMACVYNPSSGEKKRRESLEHGSHPVWHDCWSPGL